MTLTDYFAVKWGAWYYHSTGTLDTRFVTEIETYLFSAALAAGIAATTLIFITNMDGWRRKKSKRR